MKRIAILQSNYLPWKGYFDIINDVDIFVFYDEVQYTKNDWRNRNQIKTKQGLQWITVPTGTNISQKICEVKIKNSQWQRKHALTISQAYSKSTYFKEYIPLIEDIYSARKWDLLSELNQYTIKKISRLLGITTTFIDSGQIYKYGDKNEKLINIIKELGGRTYISGTAAKDYIDINRFEEEGIEIKWKDYSLYPEYKQLHKPFVHTVSIVDMLLNLGPSTKEYIWGKYCTKEIT